MSRPRAAMSVATSTCESPGLEGGQRPRALRLALVAVDRGGGDAVLAELLGEAVGAVLGAGEDERLVDVACCAPGAPAGRACGSWSTGWTTCRMGAAAALRGRDVDRRGLAQQVVGERADARARRWRRRAGSGARSGSCCQDPLDVVDEAHVEHAVGLVEHEDLDAAQVDGALADVVEQAAGRGDDDLGAAAQGADLAVHAHAAEDGHRADGPVGAVGADALLDLERELAGRDEDEGADALRGPGPTAGVKRLQHGQHEGRGLAGAGLGAGEQVAAGEDDGDGLRLDGRRLGVALVGDGAQGFGPQPKGIEGQGVS